MKEAKRIIQGFANFGKNLQNVVALPKYGNYGYCTSASDNVKKKSRHPYKNVHPWNSIEKFTKTIVDGIVYCDQGLVVINKPYGIGKNIQNPFEDPEVNPDLQRKVLLNQVVDPVNYSLEGTLPLLQKEMGCGPLKIVICPERYTSGIVVLAENEAVEKKIFKSLLLCKSLKEIEKTYLVVTTKLPRHMNGTMKVGLTKQQFKTRRKPVILDEWARKAEQRHDVYPMRTKFKLLSNSTNNLCSLMEISATQSRWHALRLFMATKLYAPILGDQIYGSMVKKVMDSWLLVNPFTEAAEEPPVLNNELLQLLKVQKGKESVIPTHLHFHRLFLPRLFNKSTDMEFLAPLMPEFKWTCEQLAFKNYPGYVNEQQAEQEDNNQKATASG